MTSYDSADKSAKSQMLPQDATQIIMESAKPFTSDALRRSSTPHTVGGKVKKALRSRLEILNWIGDYNTEWAMSDLIAGITLGLTIIPESIACALLAGLPARYGLCSAFLGSFVYLIFGSINKVIIGPTSLVALVSLQFTVGKPIEFAILLTFLTGVVELIMGSLRVGVIFEFLSVPIIKAFSSATAILVIESQIKVMLGVKYLVSGFIGSVATLLPRLPETNVGDLVMGLFAVCFLLGVAQMEKLANNPKMNPKLSTVLRYLSFSRNTLVVIITGAVSYIWLSEESTVPYALSANALAGLPNFTIPEFSVVTPEKTYTFVDMLSELNVGIIVIPIVGILTNISIGKLTPKGMVDANKELITVGLCNLAGSCVQSMPVSGAFSRYAISNGCGLKTPMANLYLGAIVLLALGFLSPYFNYIPESTLAAILMCSIVTLLDLKLPCRLWRDAKRDFCVWVLCFTVCILCGVEVGLLVSIIVTVLHLLFMWAHPQISVKIEEVNELQYIRITPVGVIYFPAINHLRAKVMKACERVHFSLPVVMDCHKITGIDFTAAQGISKLPDDLSQSETGDGPLLVIHRLGADKQKLIQTSAKLIFCDDDERLCESITQESLKNGNVVLKEQEKSINGVLSETHLDLHY
ncbi:sodium-independent sulfate anion transporter [Bactrocera neohumeralis]|uniref:sodium-independent sulfate anion transporter n=1 Tax=Bactrocera neohumeralis TaxID=98809 RepID=UPI00216577CB|nr:sodium-independent sulfate anion transporter [Bactrocera neohumeralis]